MLTAVAAAQRVARRALNEVMEQFAKRAPIVVRGESPKMSPNMMRSYTPRIGVRWNQLKSDYYPREMMSLAKVEIIAIILQVKMFNVPSRKDNFLL